MEVSDRIDAKGDEPMETIINAKSNEVFGVEWKSKINAKWYKKMTQPPPPPQNQNLNPSNIQKPQKKFSNKGKGKGKGKNQSPNPKVLKAKIPKIKKPKAYANTTISGLRESLGTRYTNQIPTTVHASASGGENSISNGLLSKSGLLKE
ncbi:hypothetical protein Tco_0951444 [Tanacetum coccineum]|uniref:Uncharacterized protein n=1 Tax=Tanacetum coccineum TaxID=301880 RepID=A0ABQ5E0W9_9ASTR